MIVAAIVSFATTYYSTYINNENIKQQLLIEAVKSELKDAIKAREDLNNVRIASYDQRFVIDDSTHGDTHEYFRDKMIDIYSVYRKYRHLWSDDFINSWEKLANVAVTPPDSMVLGVNPDTEEIEGIKELYYHGCPEPLTKDKTLAYMDAVMGLSSLLAREINTKIPKIRGMLDEIIAPTMTD